MTNNLNKLTEINLRLLTKSENQTLFKNQFVTEKGFPIPNPDHLAEFMEEKELIIIESSKRMRCELTDFGNIVYQKGGWKKYLELKKEADEKLIQGIKEKENLELEKTKVDLDLAKKMLKEYPKTKWFARIGFFIAIGLGLLEIIKFLIQLMSND
ncbi:MAG: hypothetical protein DRJ01_15080 [Bacteroidetes bacterium]|nr:MAG: hypothetical protein DRJ01_15080 [Bacteroidota bacterium]